MTNTNTSLDAAPSVRIFDTTLRDGEQSPGASMTLDEKIKIAEMLDSMGVDIIEAGFPAASEGDFAAVQAIAPRLRGATVCGLARSGHGDIDRAAEAMKPAERFRIHTFISTSPVHMKHKLQMEPDAVLDAVADSVRYARRFTDDVQWSPEDATRTDRDFLRRCVEAAIKSGATTINIPDTVGYALPHEFADLLRDLLENVPGMDTITISTHCHNDLGLAVANSLSGVVAGARQVECTINGIGERAGNAALEEVVMALTVRSDLMPYQTRIDTPRLLGASRLVSSVTGFPVQFNKAIVGRNAFSHEAGIHQDGMLKHMETYEIMRPESVGFAKTSLVMGKHSGRHAFRERLRELGYELGDNAFQDAFRRFKRLADVKKDVVDDDIAALVDDEIARAPDKARVESLRVSTDSEGARHASLTMTLEGKRQVAEAEGHGPVDAIFNAIRKAWPHDGVTLALYQVAAVTGGSDAQGETVVRLEKDGQAASARAADSDVLLASARAYVGALNRLVFALAQGVSPDAGP